MGLIVHEAFVEPSPSFLAGLTSAVGTLISAALALAVRWVKEAEVRATITKDEADAARAILANVDVMRQPVPKAKTPEQLWREAAIRELEAAAPSSPATAHDPEGEPER